MNSSIDKVNMRVTINSSKHRFSAGSYIDRLVAQKNNPASEITSVNHQHITEYEAMKMNQISQKVLKEREK